MADGDATYPHRCAKCGSVDNLKRCARCKQVLYCSREHQMQHWKSHKIICTKLSDTADFPATDKGNDASCSDSVKESNDCSTVINWTKRTNENGTSEAFVMRMNERTAQASTDCKKKTNDGENVVEFDETPYVYQIFDKPPSNDMDVLAKFATDCLKRDGYCVIDGLFTEEEVSNALREAETLLNDNKVHQSQLIDGGKLSGNKQLMDTMSEIRNDQIRWIQGTEPDPPGCVKVVQTMDGLLSRFNQHLRDVCHIEGRTKAMVAVYPGEGSFYRRHVDNSDEDGRVITCTLYLNRYWSVKENGGLLRIFPRDSEKYVDVAPIFNRLLLFWSDCRNPHEVQPTHRTRYAITVWYFDKDERRKAETEGKSEEMMQLAGEMAIVEVEQRKRGKKPVEEKTELKMCRVQDFSRDDLEIFSILLRNEPDPHSVLFSMGFAEKSAQDDLLEEVHAIEQEKLNQQPSDEQE